MHPQNTKTAITNPPPCRFGDNMPAAVHVLLNRGCVCHPNDRDQWLCAQHAINAEPLGSMTLAPDSPPWPWDDTP